MKKFVLLAAVFILFSFSLSAQGNGKMKNRFHDTWITLNSDSKPVKIFLHEVKDSSLSISTFLEPNNRLSGISEPVKIDYSKIKMIRVHQKYSILVGALIGIVAGFAVGCIKGSTEKDDSLIGLDMGVFRHQFYAWEKAQNDRIGFTLLGPPVGALVGLMRFKITIPVNGEIEKFNKNKNKIKRFSYLK